MCVLIASRGWEIFSTVRTVVVASHFLKINLKKVPKRQCFVKQWNRKNVPVRGQAQDFIKQSEIKDFIAKVDSSCKKRLCICNTTFMALAI
jgi:hypothetical protein